jgi:hypothetical protein
LAELGAYLGVIGDLRDYVAKLDATKGSTRDIYRHLDLQVRPHIPRLAVIQRTTPAAYVLNIKDAETSSKTRARKRSIPFTGIQFCANRRPTRIRRPPAALRVSLPEKALVPAANGAKDSAPTKRP